MKIYDAFLFFNELDILELRLNYLNDVVDYFVISECDYTFSGNKKPFYFEDNKERFSKFLHKIIHVKNYNTNEIHNLTTTNDISVFENIKYHYEQIKYTAETDNAAPHWCRDFLHREYVQYGLINCQDDDIVFFGDVDEFPDKTKLTTTFSEPYIFEMRHMLGSLDVENVSEPFQGTVITNYKNLRNQSLGMYRNRKRNNGFVKVRGGWHLTSMGGSERVKTKIQSWGHQEFHRQDILDSVENNLKMGKDFFGRGHNLVKIDMVECYGDLFPFIEKFTPTLII